MSSCNVDPKDWNEAAKVILTLNKNCNVVVVDCQPINKEGEVIRSPYLIFKVFFCTNDML